ncbi:unnamed protein product [Rhizophagus irregularis]|nr:unnamed protein product [Rhizophagus irregularis]CAB5376888.1 unnamed protein product [Rhizophagus irregularis]
MKKCWNSDPFKRPTIGDLENIISKWLICVNEYYEVNEENSEYSITSINMDQNRNVIEEFVKANKALLQEQTETSIIQFRPQAYYTNRLTTKILDQNSDCLDCSGLLSFASESFEDCMI